MKTNEDRVAELERKYHSLSRTMLILVIGALIGTVLQYQTIASLNRQLKVINRIDTTTELTHAK